MFNEKYTSESVANATYSYSDIADGTGVVSFYPFIAQAASITYHLSTSTDVYSAIIDSDVGNATLTFDASSFNSPRTCKGTAIINIPIFQDTGCVYNVLLQKVSGGTATDLNTAAQITKSGSVSSKYLCFSVTLTETQFKVGDNIRFVLTTSGESGTTFIGTDPANRAGASLTITRSIIKIPFKILD